MIQVGQSIIGLVALDTNATSEFLLDTDSWGPFVVKKYILKSFFPAVSMFSLVELRSRREVFDRYIEIFSSLPYAVLHGYDSMFRLELESYGNSNKLSPIAVAPWAVRAPGLSPQERTRKLLDLAGFEMKAEQWKRDATSILEGMLEMKTNYPPKGASYTKEEIENFIKLSSEQQVELRDGAWNPSQLMTHPVI